jgi:hypothetical protein
VVVVLTQIPWGAEGLFVAFGGTNRVLIMAVLVALFTVSVVGSWMRRILISRSTGKRAREWMAPPPKLVVSPNSTPESTGFTTLEGLSSVVGFDESDEPTLYEELTDAETIHSHPDLAVRSWKREVFSDKLDVLDLQVAKYVSGFRDEYFLAEAKDLWLKRFLAVGSLPNVRIFKAGLPQLIRQDGESVQHFNHALVESVVGEKRCLLKVRYCVDVTGADVGESRRIEEVWSYSCDPSRDTEFQVVAIESSM